MTLESFWLGFSDLFVLQGGPWCFPVRQHCVAVFLCNGSSSSSSQFFASFLFCFQGFRRDVREFLGGILGLVRPSGPWCFPVRQGCVAVFLCSGSSSSQFFASFLFCFQGFGRDVREFLGGILGLVPSFRAMVFPRPAGLSGRVFVQRQQRQFFASFLFCFYGFRRDVRKFLGGILGLVRPSGPWCFPVRQGFAAVFLCSGSSSSSSQFFASVLFCFQGFRVTLESFWVGFSDSFVLQGHGVSPSGRAVWPCFCAVAAAAAAAAGAAIFLQVFCLVPRVSDVTLESFWVGFSDSFVLKAKWFPRPAGPCGCVFVQWQQQQPIFCKFSVRFQGFSRDVREFLGGILGLVRPSGLWCFPVRQGCVAVFLCSGSSSSRGQFFASFLFCFQGFRCDVREFLGGILGLVRPSGPWCFPVRQGCVAVFLCSGSSSTSGSSSSQFFANKQQQQQEEHRHQQQQQQQQPIFCKFSVLFLGFQT